MFKTIAPLVCGLIAALASVGLADENDLFSGVRTDAVFVDSSSKGTISPVARINSTDQLNQMLTAAGLESKIAGSRVVLVKKALDDWAFNVLVTISEDEMSIGLTMPLSTLKDEAKLNSLQLLKLLEANQLHAPSVFTFSTQRKRTELFRILPNESITGQKLRDEINRLAVLAKGTVDLWKMPSAEAQTTDAAATTPATSISAAALIGAWSAAKSKTEALAIRFDADSKFQLVYVKSGKQTKSKGTFSLQAGTLSLVGDDGIRLQGKLAITSATKFTFTPSATIGTLEFSKATNPQAAK
ncbi:hypothetical protein [Blastopirellula marina]|uniref:Uncharacterized protein n=1 Tax=Blastopirellula marina DSM 3645 TaxID=314230 RepID=A3ZWF8_9BACT|nr:hypothetical protein [Blastopirellula marina]EAQ79186.1 hypothetical protein DSM3645_26224 [Blastopirellula marina DSM 3645]